ncbi:MAG: protocatechuate 3,4-dioxygenase, partial [Burkholderiaceae bacterium]|nr:protocatechuate 3,4-dioxygenase [Burkholderiaceae bacterium]
LHGPDFGFVNPEWDNRFLDLLVDQPEVLAQASHADYMQRGGAEGVEMMVWLAMRGALSTQSLPLTQIQRFYWGPMLTGYGLLALQAQT